MPPLLCPSPVILDHSFPRDDYQLRTAALSLGNLLSCIQSGQSVLILTATLRDFIKDIDWNSPMNHGLLREIYKTFSQLLLTRPRELLQVDVSSISGHMPHPLTKGTLPDKGNVEFWSDEVGRLLTLHDRRISGNEFFIGVACELAFAGDALNSYTNPTGARTFPLVGPSDLSNLQDCYEWDLPANVHQIIISFDDVKHNYRVIGGSSFVCPKSGSHYMVHFPGKRSWSCDFNWGSHIGENMLDELKSLCPYPLNVIKYALHTGALPVRKMRLPI